MFHSCQAEGEFTLLRSQITQRQVQMRFEHIFENATVDNVYSVGKAVVVQDEGDTPKIQFAFPRRNDSLAPDKVSKHNCPIQFFVDGVQRELSQGTGDSRVRISVQRPAIMIHYTESKFRVRVGFNYANGCFMDVCVWTPDTDESLIGLLGSPDSNANNDWMGQDGTVLTLADSQVKRMGKIGYDYCTKNWCIRDAKDSLFVYPENGLDIDDYNACDLPYGDTIEEVAMNVSQEIRDTCGMDLPCIIDATAGNVKTALNTKAARQVVAETCNKEGGECDVANCCDGLKCVQDGPNHICAKEEQRCSKPLGRCDSKPCCEGSKCIRLLDRTRVCNEIVTCQIEFRQCSHTPCCDGMRCVKSAEFSMPVCRALPQCMPKGDSCNYGVGCCDGLMCNSAKKCVDACASKEYQCCKERPVCAGSGLTCVEDKETGDKEARKLPQCAPEYGDCRYSSCCSGMECRADKRCYKTCKARTSACTAGSQCCSGSCGPFVGHPGAYCH